MIVKKISADITAAMKGKDAVKLRVLRGVRNEFQSASLRSGNITNEIDDLAALAIIRKEISKRNDSIEAFDRGGRADLIANETAEKTVLEGYLPEEISEIELEGLVKSTIVELQASGRKDMGRTIKAVMEKVKGGASNKRVSSKVGSLLN